MLYSHGKQSIEKSIITQRTTNYDKQCKGKDIFLKIAQDTASVASKTNVNCKELYVETKLRNMVYIQVIGKDDAVHEQDQGE